MAAYTLRPSLKAPSLATALPLAAALFVAAALGLAPIAMVEDAVMASGIPAVLPAAAPPLGLTARIALVVFGAGIAAAMVYTVLRLPFVARLLATGEMTLEDGGEIEMVPQVRRADAHPDAPPRAPLRATLDLGEVEIVDAVWEDEVVEPEPAPPPQERELPVDLDQPMAGYDPAALPEKPLAPPEPLRPLHRAAPAALDTGERFETFELTPVARTAAAAAPSNEEDMPITGPETEATVHALLARLERGVERRSRRRQEAALAAPGLGGTLDQLRKLAVNG